MPRALAGAGRPLRPEELPDWLYFIGRRPSGEHRAIEVWLAQEARHLVQENGRPTKDFMEERRRRRWQELDGYGCGYFTRMYRPGDTARPGNEDDVTVEDIDPRRLLGVPDAPTTTSIDTADVEARAARDARIRESAERQAARERGRRPVMPTQPDHHVPGQPIRMQNRRDEP